MGGGGGGGGVKIKEKKAQNKKHSVEPIPKFNR